MSTHWGFRCETCDQDSSRGWNHGDGHLTDIYRNWPAIRKVYDLVGGEVQMLELRCIGWNSTYSPLDFLADHEGHAVVLRSEYGQVKPLPRLT